MKFDLASALLREAGALNTAIAVAYGEGPSICTIMERILVHQNLDPTDLKANMPTKWMGGIREKACPELVDIKINDSF